MEADWSSLPECKAPLPSAFTPEHWPTIRDILTTDQCTDRDDVAKPLMIRGLSQYQSVLEAKTEVVRQLLSAELGFSRLVTVGNRLRCDDHAELEVKPPHRHGCNSGPTARTTLHHFPAEHTRVAQG